MPTDFMPVHPDLSLSAMLGYGLFAFAFLEIDPAAPLEKWIYQPGIDADQLGELGCGVTVGCEVG